MFARKGISKFTALSWILSVLVHLIAGYGQAEIPERAQQAGEAMQNMLEDLYTNSGEKIDLVLIARDGTNMRAFQWLTPDYQLTEGSSPKLKPPTIAQWLRGETLYTQKETPQFSHIGIAVRNHPKKESETWAFRHLLRAGDKDGHPSSGIYDQTTTEFFNDDPLSYRYAIVVPTREMQIKIREFIFQEGAVEKTHNPRYNSLAYPFVNESHPENIDMNSNQYVLHSVVAASLSPVELELLNDEKVNYIQKKIWNLDYIPDHMWIGSGAKIQGSALKAMAFNFNDGLGSADISTIPRMDARRSYMRNVVPVVTVESLIRFFAKMNWLQKDIGDNGVLVIED